MGRCHRGRPPSGRSHLRTSDPTALARFWSELLARPIEIIRGEAAIPATGDSPSLIFLPVPEPKRAKNRCHPDPHTTDADIDGRTAVDLAANVVEWHQETSRWAVRHDPEGNEFCIVEPPAVDREDVTDR